MSKKKSVRSFNSNFSNSVFPDIVQVRSFVPFFVWFFCFTACLGTFHHRLVLKVLVIVLRGHRGPVV